jgi:transposase
MNPFPKDFPEKNIQLLRLCASEHNRNNWVFFGSEQGGQTAAALRSFVASCQRVGVDPFVWFKDILSRIAAHPITRLAELLPHNWAPAQA